MVNINSKRLTIRDICQIAIFTALIVVMAQIIIPMPFGVPMTMQTFAITLAAVVLGAKKSAYAILVYVLMGAVGMPVFAGFNGGLGALIGPTGGFLLSFPIMAYLIGLGAEKLPNRFYFILFLILGIASNYTVGVIMFCMIMPADIITAIAACVLPFIPTEIIKATLASVAGIKIKKKLGKTLQSALN